MTTVNLPNTCLLNRGSGTELLYLGAGVDYDVPDEVATHPWVVAHQTEGSVAEQHMPTCPEWAIEAPRLETRREGREERREERGDDRPAPTLPPLHGARAQPQRK